MNLSLSAIHYTILEVSRASWLHFGAFRVNNLGVGHTTLHQAVLGYRASPESASGHMIAFYFVSPTSSLKQVNIALRRKEMDRALR